MSTIVYERSRKAEINFFKKKYKIEYEMFIFCKRKSVMLYYAKKYLVFYSLSIYFGILFNWPLHFLRKIYFGFAALLIDDRRDEAEINFGRAALRLCGFAALRLRGLVDKSSF